MPGYPCVYSLFWHSHVGSGCQHKAVCERQTNTVGETGWEIQTRHLPQEGQSAASMTGSPWRLQKCALRCLGSWVSCMGKTIHGFTVPSNTSPASSRTTWACFLKIMGESSLNWEIDSCICSYRKCMILLEHLIMQPPFWHASVISMSDNHIIMKEMQTGLSLLPRPFLRGASNIPHPC